MSFLTIVIPYFEIVMHHHLSGGSAEATQITTEERIDVKMLNTTQEALNLGSNAKPPPQEVQREPPGHSVEADITSSPGLFALVALRHTSG